MRLMFNILRRRERFLSRRLLTLYIIIVCIVIISQLYSVPSIDNEQILQHKSIVYNISDPFVITNLIDQFLYTKISHERNELWLLLVNSWTKAFEIYFQRTQNLCSPSSSFNFISQYLNEYIEKIFFNNQNFQKDLTGFGLFFDYNPKEVRSKTHDILQNNFHSPCIYFELIVLIMKIQLILSKLNIEYFIGSNTLLGSLRHHDIIPWDTIIEFNVPLNSKEIFLENIPKDFELVYQQVNNLSIEKNQIGFIYKIFLKHQIWPQIKIFFYDENSNLTLGYLKKTDIYPLHLRPFGPILLFSIQNISAMISNEELKMCENFLWNHQLGKSIETNQLSRIPCEQLHSVYLFIQKRESWRGGYCEEILKTKRLPYQTLSYFRYISQENII